MRSLRSLTGNLFKESLLQLPASPRPKPCLGSVKPVPEIEGHSFPPFHRDYCISSGTIHSSFQFPLHVWCLGISLCCLWFWLCFQTIFLNFYAFHGFIFGILPPAISAYHLTGNENAVEWFVSSMKLSRPYVKSFANLQLPSEWNPGFLRWPRTPVTPFWTCSSPSLQPQGTPASLDPLCSLQ